MGGLVEGVEGYTPSIPPSFKRPRLEFGPIIHCAGSWSERAVQSPVYGLAMSMPDIRSAPLARTPRLQLATIGSTRNGRPSARGSYTKPCASVQGAGRYRGRAMMPRERLPAGDSHLPMHAITTIPSANPCAIRQPSFPTQAPRSGDIPSWTALSNVPNPGVRPIDPWPASDIGRPDRTASRHRPAGN
jgi:hypothetical protein